MTAYFAQTKDAFPKIPLPFGQIPLPFGEMREAFPKIPLSFGQILLPFGQIPLPFGQILLPFPEMSLPFPEMKRQVFRDTFPVSLNKVWGGVFKSMMAQNPFWRWRVIPIAIGTAMTGYDLDFLLF